MRGVKNLRKDYGAKKWKTANEYKFYSDFLSQAVPLLRSTLRAELEMRRNGVFNTEISAEKQERKWRHAEGQEETQPGGPAEAAPAGVQGKPPYVPQARKRDAGENAEGFLLDTRRTG